MSLSITIPTKTYEYERLYRYKYKGNLNSWEGHLLKVFLRAVCEINGEKTKFHFHCLRHTFAVRRYLQNRDIYLVKQEMGHSSVTTTEVYAKFSLRRLEMDFPSLVKSNNSGENRERGYDIGGYTKSVNPLSASIVNT